jgi:hypothetical protein
MNSRRLVYVQNVISTLEKRFGFHPANVIKQGHLVFSDRIGHFITLPPGHEYTATGEALYELSYVEDLYEHINTMLNGIESNDDPDPDHDIGIPSGKLTATRKKRN